MSDIHGIDNLALLLPSKVPARPQHRGVPITDKHRCTSPVLAAGRRWWECEWEWEWEWVGSIAIRSQTGLCLLIMIVHAHCIQSGKFRNYKEGINLPLANVVNTL